MDIHAKHQEDGEPVYRPRINMERSSVDARPLFPQVPLCGIVQVLCSGQSWLWVGLTYGLIGHAQVLKVLCFKLDVVF